MADSYVCSGAMMRCTMGSSPAKLTVLPLRTVFLAGQPQANISDHKSMVNLAPFGVCRSLGFPPTASATAAAHGHLTPMPCVHNTPAPWFVGKMDTFIKGQPALLQSCKCQCMWGGTISLINNGQVAIGADGVNKAKHPQNSLKDFGVGSTDSVGTITETNSTQTTIKATFLDAVKIAPWLKSITPEQIASVKDLMDHVPDGSNLDKLVKVYNMMQIAPKNMSFQDKTQFAQNYIELEKKLGIQKGKKMSISEADKQKANPNHSYEYIRAFDGEFYYYNGDVYMESNLPEEARAIKDSLIRCKKNPNYNEQYSINCATCAAAYALRLLGFDVKAKGNPEQEGNLNTWLSECHSFDIWNNADGTKASPTHYQEWMQEKGLVTMTPNDYKNFFEEQCKEQGVYVVTVKWKGEKGGGHATVLQRDSDGKLYYIEPQVFESNVTTDGRRSIDNLVDGMALVQPSEKGVMRVDDKMFNVEYADLFEI